MDNAEIRLRIVEAVMPQATRVGIVEPMHTLNACKELEKYVLSETGEEKSDSPPAPKKRQPRKKATTDKPKTGTVAPTQG